MSFHPVGKGWPESFEAPKSVTLRRYNPSTDTKKYQIYIRDNKLCQFCLNKLVFSKVTLDHLIPKQLQGDNDPSNLVTSCNQCNQKKKNLTPLMFFLEREGWFSDQRLRLLIGRQRARKVILSQQEKILRITRELEKLDEISSRQSD